MVVFYGGIKMSEITKEMIKKYGEDLQLDVAVEELSELIKEVIKYKRTKRLGGSYDFKHMAEELADVFVVSEIIYEVLGEHGVTREQVEELVNYKFNRTKERYL